MKLSHPHIATLRAFEVIGEQFFLVLDYIEGTSLFGFIRSGGPLGIDQALHVFNPICDAIHYAHTIGVIHRDIKPSNIMIDLEGKPYVLDFGIATVVEKAGIMAARKNIAGTVAYMPPEQFMGAPPIPASDVYAMGVTLFQALTGKLPFGGDDMVDQIFSRDVPPIPTASKEVNQFIAKCLAKDALHRPQTAKDFKSGLISAFKGLTEGFCKPPPGWEKPPAHKDSGGRPNLFPGNRRN